MEEERYIYICVRARARASAFRHILRTRDQLAEKRFWQRHRSRRAAADDNDRAARNGDVRFAEYGLKI